MLCTPGMSGRGLQFKVDGGGRSGAGGLWQAGYCGKSSSMSANGPARGITMSG